MQFNRRTAEKIKREIEKKENLFYKKYPEALISYFDFYSLNFDNTRHYFGNFISSEENIAYHIFERKQKSTATIVVVHGYLEHSGLNTGIFGHLLEKGYNVAVFDLPGHGLSSGKRGEVSDFSKYSSILNDFLKICSKHSGRKYYILGHSTGCSAIIDYLMNYNNIFEKIILAAPLVRSRFWKLSMLGLFLFGNIIKGLHRKYAGTSNNKSFIEFMKKDPLNVNFVPIPWIWALKEWNKKNLSYPRKNLSVNIIQGTCDSVVEYKYNIKFIEKHFSDTDINYIEGASHSLLNEVPEIAKKVLSCIDSYI